jgi:hypothetical protein
MDLGTHRLSTRFVICGRDLAAGFKGWTGRRGVLIGRITLTDLVRRPRSAGLSARPTVTATLTSRAAYGADGIAQRPPPWPAKGSRMRPRREQQGTIPSPTRPCALVVISAALASHVVYFRAR